MPIAPSLTWFLGGALRDRLGTNRRAATVVACVAPVHTRFTEGLEERRRAAERRLGVHHHLFELRLITLPALVVRGRH